MMIGVLPVINTNSIINQSKTKTMNPQDAIDFSREAIKTCLMVGGPILAASLLIGLVVGVIQAMTQVQDQTVSFVPKILLLLLMIGICLPWLTERMIDFSTESFSTPMTHWESDRASLAQESSYEPTDSSPKPSFLRPASPRPVAPPVSKLPFNTAAISAPSTTFSSTTPAIKASFVPLDPTKPIKIDGENTRFDTAEPTTTSPFILPHYRISKALKTDIEG